jgi:hypothetical protein
VELGPFDLLAWQLLWIAGLWLGQRTRGEGRASALPGALRLVLTALAVWFLGWRWWSMYTGATWASHTWWLDKWHLGPLRLLNFSATAWLISNFLNPLERWQGLLRPLSLIGRHMLPIFCVQICLSLLLIGVVESPKGAAEPLTSVLVICQLITAILLGWFFEWRSDQQRSTAAAGPRGVPLMTAHSCHFVIALAETYLFENRKLVLGQIGLRHRVHEFRCEICGTEDFPAKTSRIAKKLLII